MENLKQYLDTAVVHRNYNKFEPWALALNASGCKIPLLYNLGPFFVIDALVRPIYAAFVGCDPEIWGATGKAEMMMNMRHTLRDLNNFQRASKLQLPETRLVLMHEGNFDLETKWFHDFIDIREPGHEQKVVEIVNSVVQNLES